MTRKSSFSNSRTSLILRRWLKRCTRKIIACEIPRPKTWLVARDLRRLRSREWRACDDYEGCNCADLVQLNFERECYDSNILIFKDYKAAANKDEKAFYLDGVREGIIELNVVLEEKRQQPLFCLPDKLALTVGQAEDIMMRQAEKITDPDQLPIGLLLAQGLQNTFPCDEKH